jgi:hypothetical protein
MGGPDDAKLDAAMGPAEDAGGRAGIPPLLRYFKAAPIRWNKVPVISGFSTMVTLAC